MVIQRRYLESGCDGKALFSSSTPSLRSVIVLHQILLVHIVKTKQTWNLLEDRDLFTRGISPGGIYSPAAHLAEMTALLGPPPQTLIMDRAKKARNRKWDRSLENPEEKLCERVEEY